MIASCLLFLFRIGLLTLWVLLGLLCIALVYPFASAGRRAAITRQWSRVLLVLCGVRVRTAGLPAATGAALWVANHVSWVDIFVMNSVRGVSFIAKDDVRRWPVVGWLVAGAGTVFIARGQRNAIPAVAGQMSRRFARGETVGLFPEGAASPGLDVAPFHASLFEAAIRAGVDIQPVALRFFHKGRRSDYLSFVGEQTLSRNLWLLLGTTGAAVEIEFLPVMANADCRDWGRNRVAERARAVIRRAVVCSPEPAPEA